MNSANPEPASALAPSNGQPPNNSDNIGQHSAAVTELISFIDQHKADGETVPADMGLKFIKELHAAKKIPILGRDDVKKMLDELKMLQVLESKREEELSKEFSEEQNMKITKDLWNQLEGVNDPAQRTQLMRQVLEKREIRLKAIKAEEHKADRAFIDAYAMLLFELQANIDATE